MHEFGNFDSADLWFPGQRSDPIGSPSGVWVNERWALAGPDRSRYVVWVRTGRGEEQAPRTALHLHAVATGRVALPAEEAA